MVNVYDYICQNSWLINNNSFIKDNDAFVSNMYYTDENVATKLFDNDNFSTLMPVAS